MDIFSHALWTNIAYGKARKHAVLAMLMGVLPDLIPFSPFFSQRLFFSEEPLVVNGQAYGTASMAGLVHRPELNDIPRYVFTLYNWSHSFMVFAAVFLLVYLITRNVWWPMFGWALHIGVDIFSHSSEFFPTPFLWPLSNFKISIVSWGHPVFMAANISALATVYAVWHIRKKKFRRAAKCQTHLSEAGSFEL